MLLILSKFIILVGEKITAILIEYLWIIKENPAFKLEQISDDAAYSLNKQIDFD